MHLLYPLLMFLPLAIFYFAVDHWYKKSDIDEMRLPYGEGDKLLRWPGHELIKKVKEQELKLIGLLLATVIMPLAGGGGLGIFHPASFNLTNLCIWSILTVLILGYCGFRTWKLLGDKANHYLGYIGESAVGEELNKLMREGWHVYHDFPHRRIGNIDHIVVAPTGVYCVETKCPRMGGAKDGQIDFQISYSGGVLKKPKGEDRWTLDQVESSVEVLKEELKDAAPVRGILTFPFWDVKLTEKIPPEAPIRVLYPSGIGESIRRDGDPVLDKNQMKQIAKQIENVCRDVKP